MHATAFTPRITITSRTILFQGRLRAAREGQRRRRSAHATGAAARVPGDFVECRVCQHRHHAGLPRDAERVRANYALAERGDRPVRGAWRRARWCCSDDYAYFGNDAAAIDAAAASLGAEVLSLPTRQGLIVK